MSMSDEMVKKMDGVKHERTAPGINTFKPDVDPEVVKKLKELKEKIRGRRSW